MIKINTKNTEQVFIDVKKSPDGKVKLVIDLDLSVEDLETETTKIEKEETEEISSEIECLDNEYIFYIEELFSEEEFFAKLDDFLGLVDNKDINIINLVFKEKEVKEKLQQVLFKWVRLHDNLTIMKPTDSEEIARIIFKIGDTKDFEFGTFNKFSYK